MTTFVDTSALYALLAADDRFHVAAADAWRRLIEAGEPLVTHNYVVVEAEAIVRRRLGADAVADLDRGLLGVVTVRWVDAELHNVAWAAALAAERRAVSFIDRVSFEMMRRSGIGRAFCFDPHFAEEGFETVPGT